MRRLLCWLRLHDWKLITPPEYYDLDSTRPLVFTIRCRRCQRERIYV